MLPCLRGNCFVFCLSGGMKTWLLNTVESWLLFALSVWCVNCLFIEYDTCPLYELHPKKHMRQETCGLVIPQQEAQLILSTMPNLLLNCFSAYHSHWSSTFCSFVIWLPHDGVASELFDFKLTQRKPQTFLKISALNLVFPALLPRKHPEGCCSTGTYVQAKHTEE